MVAIDLLDLKEADMTMYAESEYESCCSVEEKTESCRSLSSESGAYSVVFSPLHKTVRFDERRNVIIESEKPRSRTEEANSWYSNAEIEMFQESTSKAAVQVFGGKKPSGNFLARFRTREKDKELAVACERCKQALGTLYKESNAVRTEEDFESGQVTAAAIEARRVLQQSFQEIEDLVGLEVFILLGIRGDSSQQVRYMLDTVQQRAQGDPHQRDHLMHLMSQYVSLPSRVFMRELAVAQAAALHQCPGTFGNRKI